LLLVPQDRTAFGKACAELELPPRADHGGAAAGVERKTLEGGTKGHEAICPTTAQTHEGTESGVGAGRAATPVRPREPPRAPGPPHHDRQTRPRNPRREERRSQHDARSRDERRLDCLGLLPPSLIETRAADERLVDASGTSDDCENHRREGRP